MKIKNIVKNIVKNPTIAFGALGTVTGAVLLNLLQQFDIASKNNINVENTFIINYDSLPQLLGMQQELLDDAMYCLDRLELVEVYELSEENSENWVIIYFEEIWKFFKEFQHNQKISMQAELLNYSTVKSVGNLCKSTEKLRKFVQKHSDKKIPSAVYPLCNKIIIDYEECTQQPFTKIPNIWDNVLKALQSPDFVPNQLHRWVTMIMMNHINQ